jgi:hypothetical protein
MGLILEAVLDCSVHSKSSLKTRIPSQLQVQGLTLSKLIQDASGTAEMIFQHVARRAGPVRAAADNGHRSAEAIARRGVDRCCGTDNSAIGL